MALRLGLRIDQVVGEGDTDVENAALAGGRAAGDRADGIDGRTGTRSGVERGSAGFPVSALFLGGVFLGDVRSVATLGVSAGNVVSLEGAFWSLFVEFKFYVFAAITYFACGRRGFIGALLAAFLSPFVLSVICKIAPTPFWLTVQYLLHQLSFDDFGWFAAGSLLYLYSSTRDQRCLYAGAAMALLSALALRNHGTGGNVAASVVAAFLEVGLRNAGMPLEMASTPESATAPDEKARAKM